MKKILTLSLLFLLAGTALFGKDYPKIKLTTSLVPDGDNTICIWPVTSSGRIWVTGATLLDDEYMDGEPNYYTITSQEIVIEGDVTYLNVDDNHLTSIDLSGNPYLRSLFCANNELEKIDLSTSGYLATFDGHGNRFEAIDFSQNKKLRFVSIDRNRIHGENMTSLLESLPDQSQEQGEVKIWVIDTHDEKEQNVCTKSQVAIAKNKNYEVLDWAAGANNRKGIPYEGSEEEVASVVSLHTQKEVGTEVILEILGEEVSLEGLKLVKTEDFFGEIIYTYEVLDQNIVLKGAITKLVLNYFDVDKITFQGLPTLEHLELKFNLLQELGLSEVPSLQTLDCTGCPLGSLDLSTLGELTYLDCSNCQLSAIDVTHNPKLQTLSLYQNSLSSLDLSSLNALDYLIVSQNNLSSLDVSHNTLLKELQADNNKLSTIDLSHNAQLKKLQLAKNQFVTFDLTSSSLKELYINDNALTALTLHIPTLELLCAYTNKLEHINLSEVPNLNTLSIHTNQLETIDLSEMSMLEYLWINDNKLKSLDVSNSPKLLTIECYTNALSEKAMQAFAKTLPTAAPLMDATLILINSPAKDANVCNRSTVQLATSKNWLVYDFCEGKEGYPGLPYEGTKDTASETLSNAKPYVVVSRNVLYPFANTEEVEVAIYDLSGQLVTISRGNAPVDLSGLSTGVYGVKLSCNGEQLLLQKIVVE